MNDYVPIEQPRSRGLGLGPLSVLIVLAFLAGIGLMAYAARQPRWFGRAAAPEAGRQTGNGFTPAQPLNSSGESVAAVAPGVDPALLATREVALAAQLAALEARTATITADANAAGGQATRAESLLVAFAARRALDRGLGLGYVEEQLRARFGQTQPRAVAAVVQAARQPVTIEDLRQGLDTIGAAIAAGSADDSWLDSLGRELGHLVVLRQAGTPSPLPADRLEVARRLLSGGQVEAALAEVSRLPGADQAGNWMTAARRYIAARQALDTLEGTAIMAAVPVAPAPAPGTLPTP